MPDLDLDMNPRVVCVLGMHRSGTSLTNRMVNLLGYDLGPKEHLMVPNESNPKGFWEHQLITNLNDAILSKFGGSWDEPPSFPDGWETSPELDDLRENARAIIAADFSNVAAWSWKDPRACLTLPFWQRVMPPMLYVISLRNPVDVSRSLAKRDGFAVEKGVNLWLGHVHAALTHTMGQPRAFFFYDDFLEDWESELERLANFIGSKPEHLENNCRATMRNFVDEELRHHRTSVVDAVQDPRLSFRAKSLYLALRLSVSDHRGPNGSVDKELDGLLDHVGRYAASAKFGNLGEDADLGEQLAALKLLLASKESEAMTQKGLIDELNIKLQRHENLSLQKDAKLARLTTDQERLRQQTLQLEGTIQAQRQQLLAIENSLAWLLVLRYRGFRDAILPGESRRRRVYDFIKDLSKSTVIASGDATQSQKLSFAGIGRLWRQVAYSSIPFQTLIPVTQATTVVGSEHAIRWIPYVRIGSETKSALLCHPTTTISCKLVVPENGKFFAAVALMPEAWGQNHGGVEFEVCVSSAAQGGELKRKKLIDPTRRKRHRRWVPFQLALKRFANQEVEVRLATSLPSGATNAFAWAVWGDPAVLSRKPAAELHKVARHRVGAYGYAGALKKLLAKINQIGANVPTARQPHPFWYAGRNGTVSHLPQPDRTRLTHAAREGATCVYASIVEMMPQSSIDSTLSIVIPTKNAMSEEFESTLHAIRRQKGIRKIEIVVVDSGSKDNTIAVAKDYGAKVFCISPEQFNHGATRNYGAEQATGDILAFMVQDAIPATDDLFYKMVQGLRSNNTFAGVSVRQIPRSNADVVACWERWNHNNCNIAATMEETPIPSRNKLQSLTAERRRFLAGLDNSCSVVKRELWEKIKFATVEYAEDIRFGLQCLERGYRIGWLPDCSVIHSHTRSALEYLARYYLDTRILLEMFRRDDGLNKFSKLAPDQVLMSTNDLYLAIGEFLSSAELFAFESPAQRLNRLSSYVGSSAGSGLRSISRRGDPLLDSFFENLGVSEHNRLRHPNLCIEEFQTVLNSIVQFIAERYPRLSDDDLGRIIYKAFSIAAGKLLGEYYYACKQGGRILIRVERLHVQLSNRAVEG